MPTPRAADGDFTVWEAVNDDLKEIYLTYTSKPIFQAMADLSKELPKPIAHWHPDRQRIGFRSLEFQMSERSAQALIARRVAKGLSEGWKYLRD